MAFVCDDPDQMDAVLQHGIEEEDQSFSDFKGMVKSKERMIPPKILGLVTIEDILELIIADEIYDEADFDQKNNLNINYVNVPIHSEQDPEVQIKNNPFKNPRNGLKDFETKYKENFGKSLMGLLHRDQKGQSGPIQFNPIKKAIVEDPSPSFSTKNLPQNKFQEIQMKDMNGSLNSGHITPKLFEKRQLIRQEQVVQLKQPLLHH